MSSPYYNIISSQYSMGLMSLSWSPEDLDALSFVIDRISSLVETLFEKLVTLMRHLSAPAEAPVDDSHHTALATTRKVSTAAVRSDSSVSDAVFYSFSLGTDESSDLDKEIPSRSSTPLLSEETASSFYSFSSASDVFLDFDKIPSRPPTPTPPEKAAPLLDQFLRDVDILMASAGEAKKSAIKQLLPSFLPPAEVIESISQKGDEFTVSLKRSALGKDERYTKGGNSGTLKFPQTFSFVINPENTLLQLSKGQFIKASTRWLTANATAVRIAFEAGKPSKIFMQASISFTSIETETMSWEAFLASQLGSVSK